MRVSIHENCPAHLDAFIVLNERWIEEFFEIEDADRQLAADPTVVWRDGGAIFTGTVEGEVVGCCALFHKGDGLFELARMAVDPAWHGQGIGRELAEYALDYAREKFAATRIELVSNTVLAAAISLYRSLGFETTFEGEHPHYARANIVMALEIQPETANEFPIGKALPDWTPPPFPPRQNLEGRYCRLEPLDPDAHAASLFSANELDEAGKNWTYLPYGPFPDFSDYLAWVKSVAALDDPMFFAVVETESGRAVGVTSYLRIHPQDGVIEVGHIHFSPLLSQTRAATEAMFLMMKNAFDLGYRRYEWKCDALNAASRRAATRLGFSFEGIFRQATIYKGRNRDTAWYSVIDSEWPALKNRFLAWLDPSNFDSEGRQKSALKSGSEKSKFSP